LATKRIGSIIRCKHIFRSGKRAMSMAAARQGFGIGKSGFEMAAWRMAAKWRRRNGVSA
jgi:hypothetical protein